MEDEDEGCDDVDGEADDCDEVGRHPEGEEVHHPVVARRESGNKFVRFEKRMGYLNC